MTDVSNHYNSVHNHTKEQRTEGIAYPLKKYHNQVKRTLLETYARNAESLLDIGCGRGGDIQKWLGCNIKFVAGVDVSPREIEEAYRRWTGMQNWPNTKDKTYHFHVNNFKLFTHSKKFDIISAMFCINYFYATEKNILDFSAKIVSLLKPGGKFIGTMVDGRRLVETLHGKSTHSDKICEITQKWEGTPANFGSQFTFQITDTVVDGSPPPEYLSFRSAFKTIFEKAGLRCIEIVPFAPPQGEYWATASSLYNYFAFSLDR